MSTVATVVITEDPHAPKGDKRTGRRFVAVPREVVTRWHHKPFSELWAAADTGVDGISRVVDPGIDKEVEYKDSRTGEFAKKTIFVQDYPYYVRNQSVFRPSGKSEGFDRDDVAALHTQGW